MSDLTDPSGRLCEALERFGHLWEEARRGGSWQPDAMTLATADGRGRVSARTVLLKNADADGFVFYTNYLSRKGRDLAANSRAALCFFWPMLRRQVIVEGAVQKLAPRASDNYFAKRPRLAQLGAWASVQSQPLESPEALEKRLAEVEKKYSGRVVPRPPHWGGYRLVPDLIEFWIPGEGRLNRRERYRRDTGEWCYELVNP